MAGRPGECPAPANPPRALVRADSPIDFVAGHTRWNESRSWASCRGRPLRHHDTDADTKSEDRAGARDWKPSHSSLPRSKEPWTRKAGRSRFRESRSKEIQEQQIPRAADLGSRVTWKHLLSQEIGRLNARLSQEIAPLDARLSQEIAPLNARIEELQHGLKNTQDVMTILATKQMMTAQSIRESKEWHERKDEIADPIILDQESYQSELRLMKGKIRVNLGCGELPVPGYLNVDRRALPGVDIVADVLKLPFAKGSLSEIMSAHLVEHFRERQLRDQILPYWKSLLNQDGMIRIICPDWADMLARLGKDA